MRCCKIVAQITAEVEENIWRSVMAGFAAEDGQITEQCRPFGTELTIDNGVATIKLK